MTETLARARGLIDGATSILCITGAGVSAASGIPTYRGISGLYEDLETDEGLPIEEVLSGPMFRRMPDITWKYIRAVEEACRGKAPNSAHHALVRLEARTSRFCLLTQNVDGFHRRAGSQQVIDIHGDLHELRCTECRYGVRVQDYAELDPLPLCPSCGGVVRPAVVLFGEMLPPDKIEQLEARMQEGFDLVLSIGTSSLFPYIAGPVLMAARLGVPSIEINPERTRVTEAATLHLAMPAVEALEQLIPPA